MEQSKTPLIFTNSSQIKLKLNKRTKCAFGLFLTFAFAVVLVISTVSFSTSQNSRNTLTKFSINSELDLDLTILGRQTRAENTFAEETEKEDEEENPIVRISGQGQVRGTVLKSRENKSYYAFYGLFYADEQTERFAKAGKVKGWSGVKEAGNPQPECLQKEKYVNPPTTNGVEQCLYVCTKYKLNVYTPVLPQGRRDRPNLPVLFYIHGGGGPFGNGTRYGAKYFMDENVVLVTIEFRLGALGAFTTGTANFPGVNEYKDQVAALEWVRDKIDVFGGNPDKVMIFGNSGGGGAVQAHLLSPMSAGLFHRAIQQSGSVGMVNSVQNPIGESKALSEECGCGNKTSSGERNWVECMQSLDGKTIALAPHSISMLGLYTDDFEGSEEDSVFLPDSPWNLLLNGPLNSVPLIFGINSQEMMHGEWSLYLLEENSTNYLNDNWDEILPQIVGIPDDEQHSMARKFKQVYFGAERISYETRTGLFDLQSDAFIHAMRVTVLAYKNTTGAPVYFYWCSKEPARSYGEKVKAKFAPPFGVTHADELQYLFLYDGYPEITMDSEYFQFSRKLVKIWAHFADTGKPMTDTLDMDWPEISLEDGGMKWFELGDDMKVVEPFTKRMELWDEYIPKLYNFVP